MLNAMPHEIYPVRHILRDYYYTKEKSMRHLIDPMDLSVEEVGEILDLYQNKT